MPDGDGKGTSKDLAKIIGTTPQRIGSWIRLGMPTVGRNGVYQVDIEAAIQWAIDNGKIEQVEDAPKVSRVVANRCEVAQHFGVNEHTVSVWQRRPGFPGRAATPGRRDGYYPLDEIETWREESILQNDPATRDTNGTTHDDSVKAGRSRLLKIQCDERELRLAEKRGELIPVATATSCLERLVNQSGAIIDELPDRVLSCLPSDLSESARKAVRDTVSQVSTDVRVILSELLGGDQDDDLHEVGE